MDTLILAVFTGQYCIRVGFRGKRLHPLKVPGIGIFSTGNAEKLLAPDGRPGSQAVLSACENFSIAAVFTLNRHCGGEIIQIHNANLFVLTQQSHISNDLFLVDFSGKPVVF